MSACSCKCFSGNNLNLLRTASSYTCARVIFYPLVPAKPMRVVILSVWTRNGARFNSAELGKFPEKSMFSRIRSLWRRGALRKIVQNWQGIGFHIKAHVLCTAINISLCMGASILNYTPPRSDQTGTPAHQIRFGEHEVIDLFYANTYS